MVTAAKPTLIKNTSGKRYHRANINTTSAFNRYLNMKKIYGNHLTIALNEIMPIEFKGFERFNIGVPVSEKKNSTIQIGEKIYRRKIDDKMFLFLSIIPHNRQEQFMLEFGWSNKGRFPWDINRPTVFIENLYSEFILDECMLDYGDIFKINNPQELAHSGWKVWECSVDTSDPSFFQKFVFEDSLPVDEEIAKKRVSNAIDTFLSDVKREVLPYFEKRIEYYKKYGK
jgi:hypothetical protein